MNTNFQKREVCFAWTEIRFRVKQPIKASCCRVTALVMVQTLTGEFGKTGFYFFGKQQWRKCEAGSSVQDPCLFFSPESETGFGETLSFLIGAVQLI